MGQVGGCNRCPWPRGQQWKCPEAGVASEPTGSRKCGGNHVGRDRGGQLGLGAQASPGPCGVVQGVVGGG